MFNSDNAKISLKIINAYHYYMLLKIAIYLQFTIQRTIQRMSNAVMLGKYTSVASQKKPS